MLPTLVIPFRIVAQQRIAQPYEIVRIEIGRPAGVVLIRICDRERELITLKNLHTRNPRPRLDQQVELATNVRLATLAQLPDLEIQLVDRRRHIRDR